MTNHETISTVLALLKAGAKAPSHDFLLKGWRRRLYNSINVVAFCVGVYIIYCLFT